MRSIQTFFTRPSVSTLDRVPFQLTDEHFLYGTTLRAEAARKDALIAKLRGDGGDVDDKVATAVASAIAEEQQRAAESSKRMKRELQRKDEALKAHEGRVQTLRDEARSMSHWSPYDCVRVVNADP